MGSSPSPASGQPHLRSAGHVSWKACLILVAASLTLTLQEYQGPRLALEWFAYDLGLPARHGNLEGFAWWTVWSVGGYLVLPALLVLALPGERLREYHLLPAQRANASGVNALGREAADVGRHLQLCLVILLGALAVAWLGERADLFADAPPHGRAGTAPGDRWCWWALAVAQIVSVEFFFRGFLLQGLRPAFGGNAVFLMMVPFCMVHFGKPAAEVTGSIALGLGLGALAWRTRSIWPGVAMQLGFLIVLDPAERGRTRLLVDWDKLDRVAPWIALGIVVAAGVALGLHVLQKRRHVIWRAIAKLSIDQWRAIDADPGPGAAGGKQAGRTDWKVGVILATCCVSLILQEYVGQRDTYERWFPADGSEYWRLTGFAWWTAWRVLGYVLLPIAVLLAIGERVQDYHVSPRGFLKHLWIYGVMFALILPAVWIASKTSTFRHTYPFYRLAGRSTFDFWSWELMYAVQFLSLEFFFRGFLLQGLRRALGANAIFVMIVPYCMIHYGKPMAETMGAIGAGLILGTLAMRTRSIWGGVVIHVGVAWTMDLFAVQYCPTDGRECP